MPGNCMSLWRHTTDPEESPVRPDKLEVVAKSFATQETCSQQPVAMNFQPKHMSENRWKKFKELLPVLFSRNLPFKTSGGLYSSCVRSAMLHASETFHWESQTFNKINDRAMIRQICNVKQQDIVTIQSNELLALLGIEDLDLILKERSLCWYGHVECSNSAIKSACDIQVDGCLFVCVEVLRPSQPNRVMSSAVSLPNYTFTGQA